MAARYNLTHSGDRQTTCFHIAGDFVDLHSLPLKVMDHSIAAISECTVLEFPHKEIVRITEQRPHLARLLWLITVLDGAIHRQWLVAMGRQPSVVHLAHLICEMFVRSQVAGIARESRYDFPVTQQELADALGLSLVYVNRCVQELRRRDLIRWEGQTVEIVDWSGLGRLAEFDPTFLHLQAEPR